MNVSQRVLYNTIVQIAGKAALLLSSLVTLRLATSYLGVDGFGEYAIVLALAPILLVLGDLGIATLLSRELVHRPELREDLAATLLWIRLAASGVLLVLCLAIAPFLPYDREVRVGFVIACLGVSLLSVGSFAVPFFQVNLRLDIVALLDACTAALTVGLMLAVTQLDLGFYALVGVNVALGLVSAVASLILVRRFWRPRLRFNRALAGPLLRDGLPLGAVIVLGLLHFKVDSILLSLMRSPEEVGTYTVAYRFLEQSLVLPGVFMAAVFPLLASACAHGERGGRDPQGVQLPAPRRRAACRRAHPPCEPTGRTRRRRRFPGLGRPAQDSRAVDRRRIRQRRLRLRADCAKPAARADPRQPRRA